jgi:hypothetical protein
MNVILKFWGKLSDLLSPIYKYSYNLVHIARAMVWWVTREDHPYIYLNSASPIPLLHFPSKASSFLSITYFSRFVFLLLFLFLSLTGYSFLLLQSVFFFFWVNCYNINARLVSGNISEWKRKLQFLKSRIFQLFWNLTIFKKEKKKKDDILGNREENSRLLSFFSFFFFNAVEFLGMSWIQPCLCQPC